MDVSLTVETLVPVLSCYTSRTCALAYTQICLTKPVLTEFTPAPIHCAQLNSSTGLLSSREHDAYKLSA